MKVLHINASYKPAYVYGGPTMSVSILCEQLVAAGIVASVFTTTANGAGELPVNINKPINIDGVEVTYFKRITKDHTHFSPSLISTLWKQVKNYDLVHIHAWWNLVSVLSCLVAITRKVPVVISPRGTLSAYSFSTNNSKVKSVIHLLLGRWLLTKSYFHVTSNQEERAIQSIIKPKNITIIPNLVKLPVCKSSQNHHKTETHFKLIFFSRIDEKKGLDVLLNALTMVTAPYRLTIAGNGDDDYIQSLKKIAAGNHIDQNIDWMGFIGDEKFDMLADHDLFVLPSHDENFGNTVIESLSTGTAVLIGENVGLADYVIKNNIGWICETTPEWISNAVNQIAGNCNADLERIRVQAPAIIYNDFAAGNLVKKYITMYNQVIEHGRL